MVGTYELHIQICALASIFLYHLVSNIIHYLQFEVALDLKEPNCGMATLGDDRGGGVQFLRRQSNVLKTVLIDL